MRRKKDNNPKQNDEEDLGFLDDRIQLLDTIQQMIDIEFEQRGLKGDGTGLPDTPPQQLPRGDPPKLRSSCRGLLERLKRLFCVF